MSEKEKDGYSIAEVSNILYEANGVYTANAREEMQILANEAYPTLRAFFEKNSNMLKEVKDELTAAYLQFEDIKDDLELEVKKVISLESELKPYREEAHIPFSKYNKLEADLETAINANESLHKELTLQGRNVDRLLSILEKVVK